VVRRLLRRWLPFELRLRIALSRRRLRDLLARHTFAVARAAGDGFPHVIAAYERMIPIYPGQERFAEAKRTNQCLMAAALDGAIIGPGETFSLWRYAGRPTARRGYARAAALKSGRLTTDIGGATCLLATVVYNIALLGALDVVERKCHSVDSYGARRYFELGRDAAIEYGYTDLRFRNPHAYPVVLMVRVADDRIAAGLLAPVPADFSVEILVSEPRELPPGQVERRNDAGELGVASPGLPGLVTRTTRVVRYTNGTVRRDDLGESVHQPPPGPIDAGRGAACSDRERHHA
jgi:hypothetical protein